MGQRRPLTWFERLFEGMDGVLSQVTQFGQSCLRGERTVSVEANFDPLWGISVTDSFQYLTFFIKVERPNLEFDAAKALFYLL